LHDALIDVLHKAQELVGCLEDDLLLFVAYKLNLLPSHVYGAARVTDHLSGSAKLGRAYLFPVCNRRVAR
jgi:NADH:ubiquinone oxidoreductase subunit E